ncbi:testis-expressed protein 29 isoform X8 [Mauremys reevesii]|uniref:testis-expressed protein 29 isoform X8 n=1 Tax=Mauremys reevesii TaxID=260615 RepID=UPI00193FB08B|nr:testis-expressed protein 29 isoform X8 [Mauremys reevesii]
MPFHKLFSLVLPTKRLQKRSTHFLRHGFAAYMQVFIILILLIMGSFILFVFHRKGIKRIFNTAVTSSKALPGNNDLLRTPEGVVSEEELGFLVEKRRRKNMSRQKNTPELYPTATDFNEEDKEQLHEKKISSADSKSESQNAGEDE